MTNPFLDFDSEDKAPESLKRAIFSEINTIKCTMELVTLYVGHFFGTMGKVLSNSSPNIDDKQTTEK
jgi:hypothetical protein